MSRSGSFTHPDSRTSRVSGVVVVALSLLVEVWASISIASSMRIDGTKSAQPSREMQRRDSGDSWIKRHSVSSSAQRGLRVSGLCTWVSAHHAQSSLPRSRSEDLWRCVPSHPPGLVAAFKEWVQGTLKKGMNALPRDFEGDGCSPPSSATRAKSRTASGTC